MGGTPRRGLLFEGPPGTGKTLLARAIAGEADVPFFSISGSDFVEMFVGVGASRVRDMFEQGKKHAPCLIFIDEIDAVGRHRGAGLGGGHDEREQTLNQLLVEMDGFEPNDGIIVISATNRAPVMAAKSLRSTQLAGNSFGSILKGRLTGSMRLTAPAIAFDFDASVLDQPLQYCASGLPSTHGATGGLRWWFDGSIRNLSEDAGALTPALDSRTSAGAVGLEWPVAPGFVFGLGFGMQDGRSNGSDGSNLGFNGRSLTTYVMGRGEIGRASCRERV